MAIAEASRHSEFVGPVVRAADKHRSAFSTLLGESEHHSNLPLSVKLLNPKPKLSLSKLLPRRRRWRVCHARIGTWFIFFIVATGFAGLWLWNPTLCPLHFRTSLLYLVFCIPSVLHWVLWALFFFKLQLKAMWNINLPSTAHSAEGISSLNPHLQSAVLCPIMQNPQAVCPAFISLFRLPCRKFSF